MVMKIFFSKLSTCKLCFYHERPNFVPWYCTILRKDEKCLFWLKDNQKKQSLELAWSVARQLKINQISSRASHEISNWQVPDFFHYSKAMEFLKIIGILPKFCKFHSAFSQNWVVPRNWWNPSNRAPV